MSKNLTIIFKTKFGSHLYGTNTSDSDVDYKAVYISSLEDIVLKKDKHTYHETTKKGTEEGVRNTKDDVECEFIELRRFIKDACNGQTYALDMIFTPSNMWVESTDIWQEILKNSSKFLSKDVAPYIGYCRQQAGKYGLKGSRLGELKRVIGYLEGFNEKTPLGEVLDGLSLSEYVQRYKSTLKNSPIEQEFLDVLGKKFQMNVHIKEVLRSLKMVEEKYGERSAAAMRNEGVDWKAISHAFRCCYQLIELADEHKIFFPLKKADYLKKIKNGKIPYAILGDELYSLMEEAKEAIEKSSLPEQPDRAFWNQFILNTYLER